MAMRSYSCKKYKRPLHNNKTRKHKRCASLTTYEPFEHKFAMSAKNRYDNVQKMLIRLFHLPFSPTKITAQNDFYTWINYNWIEQQKDISKYYTQIDNFRVTQEQVYYELIDIVRTYICNNTTEKAKKLANVYHSCLYLDEGYAKLHIDIAVRKIDHYIRTNQFYKLMAEINKNQVTRWGCPIYWSVLPDDKHPGIYSSYVNTPLLTLYDYELYMDDDNVYNNREVKTRYFKYINDMFDACLGKNHGLDAKDVWEAETDMLVAMGCLPATATNDDTNDATFTAEDMYNVIRTDDAVNAVHFDWARFASLLGYDAVPDKFICDNPNYLRCITDALLTKEAWRGKKWRTYLYYINFRQIIRFHNTWKDIYYQFHGKFISGQPQPWPNEIYPIFGISMCFNTFLTNEYVARHWDASRITYVKSMATDLVAVFQRIVGRNKWLSPSTKTNALKKLHNLNIVIGAPSNLGPDPLLEYGARDAYGNMLKIADWYTRYHVKLDGKPTVDNPVIDWQHFKFAGTQAYNVNAFYTPTENKIYVPLAYIQYPFIDLNERGIEYNLAHVGYTLGHEMSHALDDLGSQYDETGRLHNWWTPQDRRTFKRKVNDVIAQYETFARYDGIEMDASLSVGEDLADISGLAICVEYLRDFQEMKKDIVPIRALSFNAFFVYVAVQARQRIFKKAIPAQLKTNPHPLDKYRVNCSIARIKLFRSLYDIKKGDNMYWHNTDTIW